MSLRSNLPTLMIASLKARDQVRLDTLRFILSQAKNLEIDLKRELNDDEMLTLLKKELKNRLEAIEQFKQGGREDIVRAEEVKLKVISEFLPSEMSDVDLDSVVQKALHSGVDTANFGLVMKAVMAEVGGKVDGKRVSEAVKKALL